MKIISKFKDYYDFIAGYDTDPRKVFVREMLFPGFSFKHEKYSFSHRIFDVLKHYQELKQKNTTLYYPPTIFFLGAVMFCDEIYPYIYNLATKEYIYDYEKIPLNILEHFKEEIKKHFYIVDKETRKNNRWKWLYGERDTIEKINKMKLNTSFGAPIVFTRLKDDLHPEYVINGNLSEISFGQAKSPQDAFTELYNWIPYNEPEMPSSPDDMQRFTGQGFDKKTSFRNVK